jgi:hypothetical protein
MCVSTSCGAQDIGTNENFVAKIEEGLAQCDVSLVVWSPDSATSVWTKEEWTSVLARQVAEQRIRLGIVLLRECPLPELLRTKNYIDARSDQGAGLRKTVKWLKRRERPLFAVPRRTEWRSVGWEAADETCWIT